MDETLGQLAEKDYEVELKLIISCAKGSKIKLLLGQNLKGETDFITRHLSIPRTKKLDETLKEKVEKILLLEFLNDKKNSIQKMDFIRRNKGDLKLFIMDCYITVDNEIMKPGKKESFRSLEEITKSTERKSLAVLNTLVYFNENRKKL